MNKKTLIILAAVFLVLAAAASYPLWSDRVGGLRHPAPAPIVLSGWNADQATAFSLTSGDRKETFAKNGGAWLVNGQPAKDEAVKDLFASLQTTLIGDLIARTAANHAALGVSDQTGTRLHLERAGAALDLIIGFPAGGGSSFYLRQAGSDNVYLATGQLFQKVGQADDAWLKSPPPAAAPAPTAPAPKTKKNK